MRFYGREKEIEILRKERELSLENSRFTVITGRRRIGKTELIDHALNDGVGSYVYLLLTRQTEKIFVPRFNRKLSGNWEIRLPSMGLVRS